MTIDEAIKNLETINHDGFVITRFTEFEALKLGIEALKAVDNHRKLGPMGAFFILPGETEDCQEHAHTVVESSPITWGVAWAEARESLGPMARHQ